MLREHPHTSNGPRIAWSKIRLRSAFFLGELRGLTAVLDKCANPACWAQFRYLHQGKLFGVEIQYVESSSGNGHGKLVNGKGCVERCWLCDLCAANVTLRFDRHLGLVMISSLGDTEGAVMPQVSQSSSTPGAIARVLVRPLDLELTVSSRGRAASDSSFRERKTA